MLRLSWNCATVNVRDNCCVSSNSTWHRLVPESNPVRLESSGPFRQTEAYTCLIFSMASAETERGAPFSLDSYYVSEELGFVLPDPLVGEMALLIYVFQSLSTLKEMLDVNDRLLVLFRTGLDIKNCHLYWLIFIHMNKMVLTFLSATKLKHTI